MANKKTHNAGTRSKRIRPVAAMKSRTVVKMVIRQVAGRMVTAASSKPLHPRKNSENRKQIAQAITESLRLVQKEFEAQQALEAYRQTRLRSQNSLRIAYLALQDSRMFAKIAERLELGDDYLIDLSRSLEAEIKSWGEPK